MPRSRLAASYCPSAADADWFVNDRFGVFVHWGLYSLAARHEWVQHLEQVPEDVYSAHYLKRFDPDLHDPAAWARAAADAGARYAVVTAKHHEGFCLWDSALTDYKSTNAPVGRDLLRPILSAFRDVGLRAGVYYSLIDWHHPHFPADPHSGPYRNVGADAMAAINRDRDMAKYARYMTGQVEELLTGYGPIDVVWFDYSYPKPDRSGKGRDDWRSRDLLDLVRRLAPGAVVNDRLDLLDDPAGWDFRTLEQVQPKGPLGRDGQLTQWESCHPFGSSWGYSRDEPGWKSVEQCVGLLVSSVSKGGNLLLNVAPTGRGDLDERTLDRLAGIGKWMRRHARSIYGCGAAPHDVVPPADCRLTYNPDARRLYVHVPVWPEQRNLVLTGLPDGAVEYAQMLHDASEVKVKATDNGSGGAVVLRLPAARPDVAIPVLEVFLA